LVICPPPKFNELATKIALPTVEIIPLVMGGNNTPHQVYLVRRDTAGDPWYGQWHAPGSVIRPADLRLAKGMAAVVKRILEGSEFNGIEPTNGFEELANRYDVDTVEGAVPIGLKSGEDMRGPVISPVFMLPIRQVGPLPEHTALYDLSSLPANTIEFHTKMITLAARAAKRLMAGRYPGLKIIDVHEQSG